MKFLKTRQKTIKLPSRLIYKSPPTSGSLIILNSSAQEHSLTKIQGQEKEQEQQLKKSKGGQNEKRNSTKNDSNENKNTQSHSGNYIDDLFSTAVKKNNATEITQPMNTKSTKTIHSSTPIESTYGVIKSANIQILSPEAPLERIDKATGLPVYKAHILKVGEGGGTPLCPFDCDCCF